MTGWVHWELTHGYHIWVRELANHQVIWQATKEHRRPTTISGYGSLDTLKQYKNIPTEAVA